MHDKVFDYPWGVGKFPGWKGVRLGNDPTASSIKSRKSMGIQITDLLRSNLSRERVGKHTSLVVLWTVEPYCSWTNAKRVWIKVALIRIAPPAVGAFVFAFIRRWALN